MDASIELQNETDDQLEGATGCGSGDSADAAGEDGGSCEMELEAAAGTSANAALNGQEAASAAAAGASPMSKNQMKKMRKLERLTAHRIQKRLADKLAHKEVVAQRTAERNEKWEAATEEEREAVRAATIAKNEAKRKAQEDLTQRMQQSLKSGVRLVIDLDFDNMMSDVDIGHLTQQISYSYSANKRVEKPCHLLLLGCKNKIKEIIESKIQGLPYWHITRSEADYLTHFGEAEKDKMVYLTADSPDELTDIDPSKIYIIGGLVDHNAYKGFCFERAKKQGIATARLPISQHVQLNSRQVLTVNHVVELFVGYLQEHDWPKVLERVIPSRKRSGTSDSPAKKGTSAAHNAEPLASSM